MNHEFSVSRWLFDKEHPAATRKEAAAEMMASRSRAP